MMTAASRGGHTASGSLTQLSSEALDITALFPKDAYSDGIENCQEILEAREDCKARRDGGFVTGEVTIVDDKELQNQIVAELTGPGAALTFQTRAGVQPLLVMYAKCLDKFFSLDVNVVDGEDNYYTFIFSNRRSIVKIEGHLCEVPMVLGSGWQYICVDLQDLTTKAFGVSYFSTIQVRVNSSCRLFRLYFAGREYADIELPPYLRLLQD